MWDLKYRPKRFSEVLGQDGTIRVLKSRLRSGAAWETSYIFSGGFGQGKTTLSRIFARALLCKNMSKDDPEPCNECDSCKAVLDESSRAFQELDAASNGTIDKIRSIVDSLGYIYSEAKMNIVLFDEMHRMSKGAQDVLLKPIEDKKLIALLCTTEAEKIRGTIRSRCEEHVIRRAPRDVILARMEQILEQEQVKYDPNAVLTVIDSCDSHIRDVINRLATIAQMGDVTMDSVREALHLGLVPTYYRILLSLSDPVKVVDQVDRACEQATPLEVSQGVAEAAMNAYRMSQKIFVKMTLVDKDLAAQAIEKYTPDQLLFLAKRFTGLTQDTKTALVCNILSTVVQEAPVVQFAPASILVQKPSVQKPVEQLISKKVTEPKAKPTQVTSEGRTDGVGPVGVDPLALTKLDHKAVPREFPRGHQTDRRVDLRRIGSSGSRIYTAREWRNAFLQFWKQGGS